ncbi:DUF4304 domain-containing protein [Algoriphagus halophilus]|uniref:DUF4304 domain-containing protein n=1 Tax=Algoriphagus halophilus TaxID=226505 RepID=UPI00358F8630
MKGKNAYKATLDEIQKLVHQDLKPNGFKKKGRTHNKTVDTGLIQAVNFQMGQFPIGDNYVVPGIRESYYGKFTVNLGVYVDELDELKGNKTRTFVQEYDCAIRKRLEHLTKGQDKWWTLDDNYEQTAQEIIDGLNSQGQTWFDLFDTRDKIVKNLQDKSYEFFLTPRAKLDAAIVQLNIDRQDGERLFQEYYDSVDDKKPHKKYVADLMYRLKIKIKPAPSKTYKQ